MEYHFLEFSEPLRFSWDVPYFGNPKTDFSGADTIHIERTEKLGNLTEVHFAVTDPHDSLPASHSVNGAPPVQAPDEVIDDSWKSEMQKTSNSLLITIHNTTRFTLRLASHDIQRGQWRSFPPDTVNSGTRVSFGAESQGPIGSQGSLSYVVDITTGDQHVQHTLPLSWTFTLIGKPQFKHKIWSLNVKENDKRYEAELNLSSDESFVLETDFVKIVDPTFDVDFQDASEMADLNDMHLFDDQLDFAGTQLSEGSYPVQLEQID